MSAVHRRPPGPDEERTGADHRVAGDEFGQLVLAPAVRAGGTHRDHEVTQLCGRVPHSDAGGLGHADAEIGQDTARIHHSPRAVRRRLVPDRRKAEHRPRVAGAQRADDQVVLIRRVLDRHRVLALPACETQGGDGRGGVRAEPLEEVVVGPGLGDDLGAVPGPDAGLVSVDQCIDRRWVDVSLLSQERFQRTHTDLDVGKLAVA